jgi:hypothetical protein
LVFDFYITVHIARNLLLSEPCWRPALRFMRQRDAAAFQVDPRLNASAYDGAGAYGMGWLLVKASIVSCFQLQLFSLSFSSNTLSVDLSPPPLSFPPFFSRSAFSCSAFELGF